MKKLLCVLMFGVVLGQAELTTRVYDYIISMQQDEFLDFTLSNITNGLNKLTAVILVEITSIMQNRI